MVAGGTGIAPFLSFLDAWRQSSSLRQALRLDELVIITANRNEPIMEKDLVSAVDFLTENGTSVTMRHFISQPPDDTCFEETIHGSACRAIRRRGRFTREAFAETIGTFDATRPFFVVACGPPPFETAALAMASDHGFPESNRVKVYG